MKSVPSVININLSIIWWISNLKEGDYNVEIFKDGINAK